MKKRTLIGALTLLLLIGLLLLARWLTVQEHAVGDNAIERLWQVNITTSARPVIVSDREMVYATDFVDGRDHLVVLDLSTGEELLRVPTPAARATIATIVVSTANEVYYGSNEPGQAIGLFHRIYVP
ncbi:MAG: hypothetical protein R3C14_43655 [Caldilineaceae bacterium]